MHPDDQSLRPAIAELERLFDWFSDNLEFKQQVLPRPVITIQAAGRRKAYGWFASKAWQDGCDNHVPEINISAEHLARGIYDICNTLIHEMVHLSNYLAGDRDCSSNGYHTKKHFKSLAERVGLHCEKLDDGINRHGFAFTSLTDQLKEKVDALDPDEDAFSLFRDLQREQKYVGEGWKPGDKKEPKLKKWSCGCTNVWSAVSVDAMCTAGECGKPFKLSPIFRK